MAKNGTKKFEPTLFFGGIDQGWHVAPLHFSIIGETGSGKTATLRMLMKSVLGRAGQGVRMVLFDPKCQFVPIVAGLAVGVPIDIAHIGDARTVAWDMQRDYLQAKENGHQESPAPIPAPARVKPLKNLSLD
jgi:hypothetical protein